MFSHLLFMRGKRDTRGAREQNLPQTAKGYSVAYVAILPLLSAVATIQTIQFYVELRKKCVIQKFNHVKVNSHTILGRIRQGIANPLLLSTLDFITLFYFIRGTYGNDS